MGRSQMARAGQRSFRFLTKRGPQGDCGPEPAEFACRRRDGDAPCHRNAGGAGPSGRPFMGRRGHLRGGNHAQVKGLVYVAAAAPESGQSFGDWWKTTRQPRGRRDQALWRRLCGADARRRAQAFRAGTFRPKRPTSSTRRKAHSPPGASAIRYWRPRGARSRPGNLVAAQGRDHSSGVQRDSADRMGAETLVLQSSHVPMLSQPEAVAEFIASAAAFDRRLAEQQDRARKLSAASREPLLSTKIGPCSLLH